VRKLAPEGRSPILCFVGPPGVGKTSLGQSIARALGRKFVRVSLGGVHDEAELRGHRRTYIGALPGNIIQAIKKAGSRDCVMMLDEVDKVGQGFHGDPNAALLEVLDPEQNNTFRDNYLGVPFDLSKVVFITTANVLDSIPGPLRDRMEIIPLPGYTEEEKLEIAKRYLVRRQLDANGLKPDQVQLGDAVLATVIRDYTREAGVRNLEREGANICRKVVKQLLLKPRKGMVRVDHENLSKFLGVRRFRYGRAEENDQIGQVTGLAWTEVGGELLTIEAAIVPGKGKLIHTGQLGDVMQESIQAAMTVVRSRAAVLGLDEGFHVKSDVHIHVPEGATPKDGPSAGIGMCAALVSALTKIPARSSVAMTGEITLRGEVLPIGGLKEKLLAAHRGGIETVLIPADNEKDLAEIPKNIKDKLNIVPVKWIDEVFELALQQTPRPTRSEVVVTPERDTAVVDDEASEATLPH
jgi:ATP-dependent Lon protease